MSQTVSATESNRRTWFSEMQKTCGLIESNNCYYHVAYRARTLSNTREPTTEKAQSERSNSRLLRNRFQIFAEVLFRSSQAARRMIERLIRRSSTQRHLDLDGIVMCVQFGLTKSPNSVQRNFVG